MRYYSTQRPVTPGSYPKGQGNKVLEIHNFDSRTYCEEIQREAWGYVEYEKPLTEREVADYELTKGPLKIIAKVPADTITYRCGERLMACEVTEKFEFVRAAAFFKTHEEAKEWTKKHPEYKWKSEEE